MDDNKPKKTRKPNLKQALFIEKVLVPGTTQTQAYIDVYGGTRENAQRNSTRLVAKPHIQEHIKEAIARRYPEVSNDCAEILIQMLRDPERNDNVKLKAIDLLAKYLGWNAPKQEQHLHAKVDLSKFKLPGGGNGE